MRHAVHPSEQSCPGQLAWQVPLVPKELEPSGLMGP